ncbi:MAG: PD40 domain-containing protein [Acidobacteria bacterium]|nr:PD40 domain-containing protein [Acidobacteriota bacterium]
MPTTLRRWTAIPGAALLIVCFAVAQQAERADLMMEAAARKERVDGDLKAAIEEYRKIALRFAKQPEVAAKALLQMGQCQEKLGQTEARKSYERIVREFGAQPAATQARARLAAMGGSGLETRPRLVWDNAVDLWGTATADGRYLSFTDWDTGDVAVRDLRTGTNRRVTSQGGYMKAQAEAGGSAISPDGSRIAYTWERFDAESKANKVIELRVIGFDGQGDTLLKQVRGWIEPQGWSPDGKRIAALFQEPAFVETEILVLSAGDGSSQKVALKNKGMKYRVTFSPDGQWLAYSSGGIVYSVRADGSAAAESQVVLDAQMLAWTPDGKGIVFSRKHDGVNRIFLVPVFQGKPSGEPRMLRTEALPDGGSLGMTTQGTLLLAAPNVKSETWILEFDGTTGRLGRTIRQLEAVPIGPPYVNSSVKFSPDGKLLLYRRGPALLVHNVATGEERKLAVQMKQLARVEWATDGASLLAAGVGNDDRDGLHRVDVRTGAADFLSPRVPETRIVSAAGGAAMIYSTRAGTIVHRDLATNEEKTLWRAQPELNLDQVPEAVINREANRMAVRAIHYVGVVDLATGETRRLFFKTLGDEPGGIWAVDWSSDGQRLVAIQNANSLKERSRVMVFSMRGGEMATAEAPAQFRGFSLSPDGKLAAALASTRHYQVLALENFLPVAQD